MPPKQRHISVSGLIISAFIFMSAIVFLSEDETYYWTLLLFLPLLLLLVQNGMRKESADVGD
jgi:hypothetical protein